MARAAAGATRWLVLSGPPGIGKTRLAEEIAGLVGARGGDGAWVSCPDERATPPWWPMRRLVRALGADADEVLEIPAHADPDTARFLVYERIQALLESAPRLLAVVVDDVQWSDTASAACLAYIAGALRDHPVLGIATGRDPCSHEVKIAVFSFIGQVFHFRVGQPLIMRRLEWDELGEREAEHIVNGLVKNTRAIVLAYREKA